MKLKIGEQIYFQFELEPLDFEDLVNFILQALEAKEEIIFQAQDGTREFSVQVYYLPFGTCFLYQDNLGNLKEFFYPTNEENARWLASYIKIIQTKQKPTFYH